jgi:hypothetical protein
VIHIQRKLPRVANLKDAPLALDIDGRIWVDPVRLLSSWKIQGSTTVLRVVSMSVMCCLLPWIQRALSVPDGAQLETCSLLIGYTHAQELGKLTLNMPPLSVPVLALLS